MIVRARTIRVPLILSVMLGVVLIAPTTGVGASRVRHCVVPNLAGQSLKRARQQLKHADCGLGKIVGNHAGKITAQKPRAGKRERLGTKVTVTVKLPVTLIAPKVAYSTSVDPAFTQAPSNPLQVTYAISAGATETEGAEVKNLAADDQLPGGVLNFYSATTPGGPESLYCSVDVGGSTDGSSCPVSYTTTGTYAVTTEYIPTGTTAVTETDEETISPFTTTATVAVTSISCPSPLPVEPDLVDDAPDCYTVTPSVIDQNHNTVGGTVLLTFTPAGGGAAPTEEVANVTPNDGCTVLAYGADGNQHGWIVSPNCGFEIGSLAGPDAAFNVTAWTVGYQFAGISGWDSSVAQPTTLTAGG